jgi:hypothetical protein
MFPEVSATTPLGVVIVADNLAPSVEPAVPLPIRVPKPIVGATVRILLFPESATKRP